MRAVVFISFVFLLSLCISQESGAWPPDPDSHPCYEPDTQFVWCNNDLPSQRFARNGTEDQHDNLRVTVSGTEYSVQVIIHLVYYQAGGIWYREDDCNSSSATPAAYWDSWTCAKNVGDPWYQNWDACKNGGKIKMMLYCWREAGAIDAAPGLGANPAPKWLTDLIGAWLDNQNRMLRPSTSAPTLVPAPAPRHVYSRSTNNLSTYENCPNYGSNCP